MDKEKQIEEMANIICKETSNKGLCEKCGFKKHEQFGYTYQCHKFDYAQALYNAGYRKIDEGSVVISEEEYERLEIDSLTKNRLTIFERVKIVEQARKQAVKEFAERLKESLNDMEYRAKTERKTLRIEEVYEQMNWILHKVVQSKIDEIAKEFGVEL